MKRICVLFLLTALLAGCAGTKREAGAGAGEASAARAPAGAETGAGKNAGEAPAAPEPSGVWDNVVPVPEHERQNVAVYMAGNEPQGSRGSHRILGQELAKAISQSGRYFAVDRTEATLTELAREHTYQRTGAVSDDQIKSLGAQLGVQFLCIAEISEVKGGTYYLSARLVDVVTAQIAAVPATAGSNLKDINEMMRVARLIACELMGGNCGVYARQAEARADMQGPRGGVQSGTREDFKDSETGIEMVFVKGGTFRMGCTSEQSKVAHEWEVEEKYGDCRDNEKPTHMVTLSDFFIGRYEITQKQWKRVTGENPAAFNRLGEDLPVESVSWDDVQEFIKKLNLLTGKKYRLPTEAEWEYAARGGAQNSGFKYSGSSNPLEVAWIANNANRRPHKTGTKQPNELGIFDMSGNVLELVNDWFGKYSAEPQVDPAGPPSSDEGGRVARGGSWQSHMEFSAGRNFRNACRNWVRPDLRSDQVGFRLALTPD